MNRVVLDDIRLRFGGRDVLRGVTLALDPGVTALVGRNGAGKTSLLRVLVRVLREDSGTVTVDGVPLGRDRRQRQAYLAQLGWLPQSFGFPRGLAVQDFVEYAAWLKRVPTAKTKDRARSVVDQVGLSSLANRPLGRLSGGERRRAGLAAAIVSEPSLLLLDEPTAGLDPEQRADFHELVRSLSASSVVLVATHLLEDVEAVADRAVVLHDGRDVWQGTTEELADGGGRTVTALRTGLRSVLASEPRAAS